MTQPQVTPEDIDNLRKAVTISKTDAKELIFEIFGFDSDNPFLTEKVELLVDQLINGATASAYLRILAPTHALEGDPS